MRLPVEPAPESALERLDGLAVPPELAQGEGEVLVGLRQVRARRDDLPG